MPPRSEDSTRQDDALAPQSLTVDEIMAQVRHEVVRRGGSLPAPTEAAAPGPLMASRGSLVRWQASAPRIPVKREYVLSELLSFSDRDFLEVAYRALLRRAPDEEGLEHYLSLLRNGRASKVEVLATLRWSAEGEKEGVHVDGLLAPYLLQKWRRKPVVGPAIGWMQAIARLPWLFDRQVVLDAAHARESQELGRTFNIQADQVEQRLAMLEARLEATNARLEATHANLEAAGARQEDHGVQLEAHRANLEVTNARLDAHGANLQGNNARIEAQAANLQATNARLDDHAANLQDNNTRLDAHAANLQGNNARLEVTSANLEATSARLEGLPDVVPAVRLIAEQLERDGSEQAVINERVKESLTMFNDDLLERVERRRKAHENRVEVDALLAAFEEAFHGDRAIVRSRYQPYVALFNSFGIGGRDTPVFDLASGRGEWLELLKELQLVAQGVDGNRLFAEICRGRGLQVEAGDAVEALAARAEGSVGAVTLMRSAGNMPLDRMIRILDQSARVLRPGGLVMLHGFDPSAPYIGMSGETGYHPSLPPETVRWLLEARGFYAARIVHPAPASATAQHYDGTVVEGVELMKAPPAGTTGSTWECAVIARKLL